MSSALKNFVLACFCSFLAIPLTAQKPYFQQDVAYQLHVRLDDQSHVLRGHERMSYKNNSPDTLKRMYIHLWPNAFSSTKSAFAQQQRENGSGRFERADEKLRGGIDSLAFKIDGQPAWWQQWEDHPDVVEIWLPEPLPPGDELVFETPFRVKIPASFSRLGHIKQQYQLTQWFPKPAVYDKDGWHPMPYLSQGEFYSEFGTFDVYIEVPRNYVVGATGDLPANDPERRWLERREKLSRENLELPSDKAIFKDEFPENEYKVLHFHQENVHDFAWFCDKRYYVLTETVRLPYSGKEVQCVAMFNEKDKDLWKECPRYIAQSIHDYSLWNGDYPYAHATAVDGALSAGAGMEYPNITVLGSGGSAASLEQVTMHEVGHNWFYGMLGSNERLHPWMDEGLNTFMENRYWADRHPGESAMVGGNLAKAINLNLDEGGVGRVAYEISAFEGFDQPIEMHSKDYTQMNYGVIVYMKTGQAFKYLEGYLGRERIDACFRAYFEKWKFKHPQPEDLQQVFEETSGEKLDWFFKGLIPGTHKLDFRITKTHGKAITVANRSGLALPAPVNLLDKEGKVLKTYWTKPFEGKTTLTVDREDYHRAWTYQSDPIPDWREGNNQRKRKGLAKGGRGLKLNFGYKYPDPDRFDVNWMPAVGFNTTDGFMAGLLVHHGFLPRQPFSFHLMPMYGFKSKRLTGSAGLTYRWLPSSTFRKIELKLIGSSFSTFARSKQALVFHPWKQDLRGWVRTKFTLESLLIGDRTEGDILPDDWYLPAFGRAIWQADGRSFGKELHARIEVGGNLPDKVLRASGELTYKHTLGNTKNTFIKGRVFVGGIFADGETAPLFRWGLSGSGDPFAEGLLFDRAGNSSWLSNQLLTDHGAFSTLEGAAFDRLLTAGNFVFHSPIRLEAFGDIAYGRSFNSEGLYYAAGIRVPFMGDALRINFPIYGTVYDGLPEDLKTFSNNITFTFEPMKFIRNVGWNFIDF